jgi:endo-1,4-beta-D-glucanase Y
MKRVITAAKWSLLACAVGLLFVTMSDAEIACPFPQSAIRRNGGLRPDNLSLLQINSAVSNNYIYWKGKYLAPSTKAAGDYKVKFDTKGTTVSEAMGYGMLLTVYMAGADTNAKACFDGLNRFRKRYPSSINPALMCWKIPANEKTVRDDCATDGDLDMAFALLLAHKQWGDEIYFVEATNLIHDISQSLVRADYSLRLGDWNSADGQTRPSDFMPTHFRAFYAATGDAVWTNVEAKSFAILEELQTKFAAATGLVPDFAVTTSGKWQPAKPKFLEGQHDGEFNYNACRVPWRIGWAGVGNYDERAQKMVQRFMAWATNQVGSPDKFKAGYGLDGTSSRGGDFDTACFISPTGVAAMACSNQVWLNQTFSFVMNRREGYYEDSVNLLCLLVMSGNAWLPDYSK